MSLPLSSVIVIGSVVSRLDRRKGVCVIIENRELRPPNKDCRRDDVLQREGSPDSDTEQATEEPPAPEVAKEVGT